MAKNTSTVYLGYEDECVSDKYKKLIDFTTNKCGGYPAWPNADISIPPCPICGLERLFILQVYAPLELSQFHRTLYLFSCINAFCSNQSKGWICVRVQVLEKHTEKETGLKGRTPSAPITNWCSGANDWNDLSDDDKDNKNEQNGNIIINDNFKLSDDDESYSLESDPIPTFNNLQVDEKNANCGAQGAELLNSPNAFAEIEGEESEMVTIDSPTMPQRDLIAMLKQTTAIPDNLANVTLRSFFIAVDEERLAQYGNNFMNDHIREMIADYENRKEVIKSPSGPGNVAGSGPSNDSEEKYEKCLPRHGDLMFHNFMERIQENPGQILRYSRDSFPLLIAPINELVPKCQNCGAELICEVQILPTLIPKLRFSNGDLTPIEYGNILVFTCTKSCWDTPDKMRCEIVICQPDK